ncbi:cupredoxin domain-containing protein [Haloarcula onubensis]|uniref:Plastocyanin/azurin family copper-binding protein n=1 Tax=Haloarcula onubensis TaxID=2950539 RepID=A0ABU2FJF7_9EURY|nr:plastocyanin/azurin family copper-binding protein [Halomicroarcula sp. S3CR25-11]MDS0280889.1 plastocyanin/azurin family copper-binding protein [Halomicroarcula sp. S3CR25-11]
MDRRTILRVSGVTLAAGLAGCGGSSSADTPAGSGTENDTLVEMTDDLAFEPSELTVSVGDTVTWENTGSVPHSVTAYEDELPDGATYFASGGFDSESAARDNYPTEGAVGADETYEHTFETAGEFPYFCIPHESGMKGTIVVES